MRKATSFRARRTWGEARVRADACFWRPASGRVCLVVRGSLVAVAVDEGNEGAAEKQRVKNGCDRRLERRRSLLGRGGGSRSRRHRRDGGSGDEAGGRACFFDSRGRQ